MPADGHLLLFADPDPDRIGEGNLGSALHMPAGTPVEERPVDLAPEWKNYPYETDLPEGLLRLAAGVSLPYYTSVYAPEQPLDCVDHPEHPHANELIEVWTEMPGEGIGRGLQLGGYAEDEDWAEDPSVAAGREAARAVARGELPSPDTDVRPEDWVSRPVDARDQRPGDVLLLLVDRPAGPGRGTLRPGLRHHDLEPVTPAGR